MSNSRRRLARASTLLLLFVVGTSVAACGADRSGGPRGNATAIVSHAPDLTVATGSARVAAAVPTATSEGTIDFTSGRAKMRVEPPSATEPALTQPGLALDVVRAVVSVLPYGGAEVRGASTIKYEVDVAPSAALAAQLGGLHRATFYADVFVDSLGRLRRVTIPIDLNEPRPSDTKQILAKLVTIDFYDFGRQP